MAEILVKVENVSKKFCRNLKRSLWYGLQDIAGDILGFRQIRNDSLRKDEFWAVKDLSFELRRGDCLGLIGHNGAGKSTLLKMLNGLIRPDEGKITIVGKVGALIELGAGFNPVLSGRENIYINGQVLGFSKREIDAKFDSIVEFAELGDFIDMPVRNYSSGMKVRLGFAVAAQMEPDVLIIDEVLAVGDVGFTIKCFNAISNISRNAAVIFVSHSMPQVARVASSVLLMSKGRALLHSDVISETIEKYYSLFGSGDVEIYGDKVEILECQLNGQESRQVVISYRDTLTIGLKIKSRTTLNNVQLSIGFLDKSQKLVAIHETASFDLHAGTPKELSVVLPDLIFSMGIYSITYSFESITNDRREVVTRYRGLSEICCDGTHSVKHASFVLPGRLAILD